MTSELIPLYDQWNLHHSATYELTPLYNQRAQTSEFTPLYDTLNLTTTYAFTLTRHGLPGCLTTLHTLTLFRRLNQPIHSIRKSTHTYTHTHTHMYTHNTYTNIHVAQTMTL